MDSERDNAGRFRRGCPSPNPNGRPRKEHGVDAALNEATKAKVTVTEDGKRKRKSKLDVTATQLVNKGAGGDLRAAKLVLDQARMAEQNEEAARARAPVMTQSDHDVSARAIARLAQFIMKEMGDDLPKA